MPKSHSSAELPFVISARDLARRPGTQRSYSSSFPAPEVIGTDVIGVPKGAELKLEVSLESVSDGIWISGTVAGTATGECGRCLDAVTIGVAALVQGLFYYPDIEREDEDENQVDLHDFDGENLDVEEVVRDAVVTSLPFTPLCAPDCPGLCDRCGARLAEDPDHKHDEIDPRWSALGSLIDGQDSTETKES